ncbi:hypothetical protein [Methanocaldococcus infernus]
MDEVRRYGLYSLIVGILSLILMFYTEDKFLEYSLYIISIPSLIFGIGSFLIPKVRRSKIGRIPFRGF